MSHTVIVQYLHWHQHRLVPLRRPRDLQDRLHVEGSHGRWWKCSHCSPEKKHLHQTNITCCWTTFYKDPIENSIHSPTELQMPQILPLRNSINQQPLRWNPSHLRQQSPQSQETTLTGSLMKWGTVSPWPCQRENNMLESCTKNLPPNQWCSHDVLDWWLNVFQLDSYNAKVLNINFFKLGDWNGSFQDNMDQIWETLL